MSKSIIPQLLPIEINIEKKKKILLTNVIKMLTNRKILDEDKLEDNIKKITENLQDTDIYTIKMDHGENYYEENNNNNLYIKLLNQKITSITKTSNVGEFLYTNTKNPKIIVCTDITVNIHYQIFTDFPYVEIFKEEEMMIDLISHITVPKHELLSKDEAKKVLDEYNAKKKELPKIYVIDPVSKYYNAKVGQIFRIIRPSETSVLAPYYRLVITGSYI